MAMLGLEEMVFGGLLMSKVKKRLPVNTILLGPLMMVMLLSPKMD